MLLRLDHFMESLEVYVVVFICRPSEGMFCGGTFNPL